ncbi:MAG: NUDIX hydrolase [Candidatus Caldarchaeum sp.]|nr:NUDIX hydrolase [Candidatus Caldarchaeum sp.]
MKEVRSEEVFKGRVFSVRKSFFEDDGRSFSVDVVAHPGSVAVIPILDDGKIVLIEQFRPVVGRWLLELPAGTIEKESPEICAERELLEETGYTATELKKLAEFYLAPGYSTELLHLFVARGLSKHRQSLEEDERIKLVEVSTDEARQLIRSGKVVDAKTIASLLIFTEFYGRR